MDINHRQLKREMIAHAKKCGEVRPFINTLSKVWGKGAETLAWRITHKHCKTASRLPKPVYEFLHPESVKPSLRIIPVDYTWSGAPVARNGAPPGIVWHHAAGYGTPTQIHAYHKSIGDRGIGYHFYVTRNGNIYRGRPEDTMGAHCLNHNDWIGVCAEGNYEARNDMPKAQLEALKSLHYYLDHKYHAIDKKHRDMSGNSTACPGRYYPFSQIVSVK